MIVAAREISDKSWLNNPQFGWFKRGYDYAATQTQAIPVLSQVPPEQLYFAVCSILRGAGLVAPDEEPDEETDQAPDDHV